MESKASNSNFLQVLLSLAKKSTNPFISDSTFNYRQNSLILNPYGFIKDLSEKEVRCPICLGRVKSARRPNSCYHSFCFLCLKKWKKNSNKCPICLAQFDQLLKIDINDIRVKSQLEIFV